MDQQIEEPSRTKKISRSQARHLRRKKLNIARKAAVSQGPCQEEIKSKAKSKVSHQTEIEIIRKHPQHQESHPHQISSCSSEDFQKELEGHFKTEELGAAANPDPYAESIKKRYADFCDKIKPYLERFDFSSLIQDFAVAKPDGEGEESSLQKLCRGCDLPPGVELGENYNPEKVEKVKEGAEQEINRPGSHECEIDWQLGNDEIDSPRLEEIVESSIEASNEPLEVIRSTSESRESEGGGNSFRDLTDQKITPQRMNPPEKTREQIKAEREAKKAAKAAAKKKGKSNEDPKLVPSPAQIPQEVEKCATQVIPVEQTTQASKEPKDTPPVEGKSKSELRAERRAKQEAQRAAKLEEKRKPKVPAPKKEKVESPPAVEKSPKRASTVPLPMGKDKSHEVHLFKHLYQERETVAINVPRVNSEIHPAIVRLGVQYAKRVIVGGNARCVALLAAVKRLIRDYERPPQEDFTRGLEANLKDCMRYLNHCRPIAVSMQNALRHIKWQMAQLSPSIGDEDAKAKLESAVDTYVLEQIQLADKAISITIQTKISNGDVILTYGYSSLIHKILLDAHTAGRQFRVVVVDGRPWLEGKEQLKRLAKHGVQCSYILINGLSFIMPTVSKVFLGAHAILANGAVMSRVGTAQVALMAKAFNVPVLVACETHKSCERVQTDSIVYNELGNADDLIQNILCESKKATLANWKSRKTLNLLNLTYDVTPADLVTAVVTELAILPCTSVPVILRIKPSEI